MADVAALAALDWPDSALPDGFTPVDAIVLVKGYYETDDGDMTRMVWAHKWTRALAQSPSERSGQLDIAHRMCVREAMRDYQFDEDDDA